MLLHAFVLVSTVLLLMSMTFSVLGSTPLLILKHDTPMDGRVVRQVFHYCYRMVAVMGAAAALAYALSGRLAVSVCLAGIAALALALHRVVLARMDALRNTMYAGDTAAVRHFRQLHGVGVVLNLTQLAALAWGMTRVTL